MDRSEVAGQLPIIKNFISQELEREGQNSEFLIHYALKITLEKFSSYSGVVNFISPNPYINTFLSKIESAPALQNAFTLLTKTFSPLDTTLTTPQELNQYLAELDETLSRARVQSMEQHLDKVPGPISDGKYNRQCVTLTWGVKYICKGGDHKQNHNNRIDAHALADKQSHGKLTCRHLSWEVLVQGVKPLKDYHAPMSNLFKQQSTRLVNNDFDLQKIRFRANNYYFVHMADNFGDVLYSIAENLQIAEMKSMIFLTANHQIAFTIEFKTRGYFALKWYDPNRTESHWTYLAANVEKFKEAKLDDFMAEQQKIDYFSRLKSVTIAVYDDPQQLVGDGTQVNNFNIPDPTHLSSAEILNYSLVYNASNSIEILKNIISKHIDGMELFQILGNDSSDPGQPLFFQCALGGHRENFVKEFVISVAGSKILNSEQKVALLKGVATINGQRYSLLFLGINSLRVNQVEVYTNEILNSGLTQEEKVAILSEDDFSPPPFNGDRTKRLPAAPEMQSTLETFVNIIKQTNVLEEQNKTEVLQTQRFKID